jgi:hypothetical protein
VGAARLVHVGELEIGLRIISGASDKTSEKQPICSGNDGAFVLLPQTTRDGVTIVMRYSYALYMKEVAGRL